MNTKLPALLLTTALLGTTMTGNVPKAEPLWADGYVVVLGTGHAFTTTEPWAKRIAQKSGVAYDRLDRDIRQIDNEWCGRMARDGARNAKGEVPPFVSVEQASVYGLKKRFIIAGAVTDTLADAKRELHRYRSIVPDAYIKKFRQYMGCRS